MAAATASPSSPKGVVLDLDPEDLAHNSHDVERDAHGHVRLAEVNIGEILKAGVQPRLHDFGVKTTIAAKNIGYELRCADPVPMDHGVHARPRLLRRQAPASTAATPR